MSNFQDLAAKFIARVNNATFSGTTDVDLIYYLEDAIGKSLSPHRDSIMSHVSFRGYKDGKGTEAALQTLKQTAIDNIRSIVPNTSSDKLIMLRGVAGPVRIVGFELDIHDDVTL